MYGVINQEAIIICIQRSEMFHHYAGFELLSIIRMHHFRWLIALWLRR